MRPKKLSIGVLPIVLAAGAAFAEEKTPEFNRDIRPLLANYCYECHGPDANLRQAGLRLDTEEGASAMLDSGVRAVAPGNPEQSELLRRVSSPDPDVRMPPADTGKRLSPEEIETLRRWIAAGAGWQGHWSYLPLKRPAPPQVSDSSWPRGPIDRFVLRQIEEAGLSPSPEADRRTLYRRLSFDLLGLPPDPKDVEAFVADNSPLAYERLVDELLASPHFGERQAIYWLDLVRYADSAGYHSDPAQNISLYRDYVIGAFNDNLPFDRFTLEQVAGDLLLASLGDEASEADRARLLAASGYNRLNKTTDEGGAQPKEYLAKYAADRVRTTSSVWMGATLGCAECHDHKFDPYTAKDFYSFAAFFADLQEQGKYPGGSRPPEMALPDRGQRALLEEIDRKLERLAGLDDADQKQIESLKKQRAELEKQFRKTLVSVSTSPREMRVLPRGNWLDESGEVVSPGLPEFLPQLEVEEERRLNRLDLARWFVSPENPQTARVFVNRLWKLYFGAGISRLLDDLGTQGQWPTHPELLDWMAVEFRDSGWDINHMIRQTVTSAAYRQTSAVSPELRRRDPYNKLFARQSRWRVEAEVVRDTALETSGLLVRRIGGRSVFPYQPAGYWQHLNFPKRSWKSDTGANQYRRGLYTHWQRTFLHPSLLAFDAPSREECTAQRPVSNTPTAALALLNDPTYVEAARALGERILREGGQTPEDRVRWAWRETLAREPDSREAGVLLDVYKRHLEHYTAEPKSAEGFLSVGLTPHPKDLETAPLAAWTSVARVLLNLSETISRN